MPLTSLQVKFKGHWEVAPQGLEQKFNVVMLMFSPKQSPVVHWVS